MMEEERNESLPEAEEPQVEGGETSPEVRPTEEITGSAEEASQAEPSATGEAAQAEPAEEEPAQPEKPSPAPGPAAPEGEIDVEVSSDDRLMAALAWLGLAILQIPLVSLVLLVAEENKRRPFQRFHAINSTIFWVAGFVYEIIAVIVYLILTFVTLGCLGFFLWIIFFFPHLVALYYAYQAYQGEQAEIPFITEFARSQGWL